MRVLRRMETDAGVGFDLAGEDAEQGGFAGTVAADQAEAFALGDAEGDVLKEQAGAEGFGEAGTTFEESHGILDRSLTVAVRGGGTLGARGKCGKSETDVGGAEFEARAGSRLKAGCSQDWLLSPASGKLAFVHPKVKAASGQAGRPVPLATEHLGAIRTGGPRRGRVGRL